jgi:biotin transport system substrate-specific component
VKRPLLPTPFELVWVPLGAALAAVGSLIQVSLPSTLSFQAGGLAQPGYTFSFQLLGLLLAGFMAGGRAAGLSQVLYLALGLSGLHIFTDGGGTSYIQQPTFGYLLGFVPGAWLCGLLSDRFKQPTIGRMAVAGLTGMVVVHVVGIAFLLVRGPWQQPFGSLLLQYSLYVWLGQLVVLLVATILASGLRRIMLY